MKITNTKVTKNLKEDPSFIIKNCYLFEPCNWAANLPRTKMATSY